MRRPPLRLAAPSPLSRRAPPRACAIPARSPGTGSRWKEDAQGRDWSPRPAPDPERAGIKPGRWRRGLGPCRLPRAERRGRLRSASRASPLGPGSRSRAPHATTGSPRRYLLPSNEESPGEPTGADRDVSCGRVAAAAPGNGGLKLSKVASQREAAARREQKEKGSLKMPE